MLATQTHGNIPSRDTGAALESTAKLYDTTAAELELAARHCRTAAEHFRNNEVPRGAAHAWAALGHVLEARESLHRQAREHASRSVP